MFSSHKSVLNLQTGKRKPTLNQLSNSHKPLIRIINYKLPLTWLLSFVESGMWSVLFWGKEIQYVYFRLWRSFVCMKYKRQKCHQFFLENCVFIKLAHNNWCLIRFDCQISLFVLLLKIQVTHSWYHYLFRWYALVCTFLAELSSAV